MKRSTLLALLLVILAMFAAAEVSQSTFDRLPHLEDEFAYLFQARIFEHGKAYIPTPEPNRAYWQPFLISLEGKRFGKYPPGWPLLLAVGTALNMPWVVNVWFAGLNVALIYRFGRELYDETAGVAAALLMAISPIALLLNATLMSHTSTLFFALVFTYGLWRIERGRRALLWGAVAGAALGMVVAARPLAAVGVAAPFVIYSLLRLVWILARQRTAFFAVFKPLFILGLLAILYAALFPAFNYAVSGDATKNLYTLIWSYDRVGFGEGHGRYGGDQFLNIQRDGIKISMWTHAGHTFKRGWRNAKQDMKCYSRDLFGWVQQPDNPPEEIRLGNDCLVDKSGLSWVLLPFGVVFMRRRHWSLLLLAVAGALILVQTTYWIGAGVYSARYYFEATGALALVSGAGVSGLCRVADRFRLRYGVYALLGIAAAISLIGYTPRRLEPLWGYGHITDEPIKQVQAMRYTPDTPLLIIVSGDHHWRDLGAFMALTDPYAQSPIIALRDPDQTYAKTLMARYPDRQVIFMVDKRLIPVDIPGRAGYVSPTQGG